MKVRSFKIEGDLARQQVVTTVTTEDGRTYTHSLGDAQLLQSYADALVATMQLAGAVSTDVGEGDGSHELTRQ